MDNLASSVFRKYFAKLDQPTIVTVNGHPIGVWSPYPHDIVFPPIDTIEQLQAVVRQQSIASTGMSQREQDAILRRVNKGG